MFEMLFITKGLTCPSLGIESFHTSMGTVAEIYLYTCASNHHEKNEFFIQPFTIHLYTLDAFSPPSAARYIPYTSYISQVFYLAEAGKSWLYFCGRVRGPRSQTY